MNGAENPLVSHKTKGSIIDRYASLLRKFQINNNMTYCANRVESHTGMRFLEVQPIVHKLTT